MTYFTQSITLLASFIAGAFELMKQNTISFINLVKAGLAAAKGDFEEADRLLKEAFDTGEIEKNVRRVMGEVAVSVGQFTGALAKAAEEEESVGFQTRQLADDMEALQASMEKANAKLTDFLNKMQEDTAELALKQARAATEAALRESYRQEDLARRHADNVARIMEGAAQSQRDAMERHSQNRISIERDYQRQVRDLQRDFEYEAEELARSRDAVGLLRAMRNHNKQLEDAKIAKNDQRKDADIAYRLERQAIDARKQEALQSLAEQEAREEEEFQRGLKRQQELQALHDKWAEEDRKRKYAKQLADMLKQFKSLEGMTDEKLDELLDRWRLYFGDLVDLALAEMQRVATITATGTGISQSGANVITLPPMIGPPPPPSTGPTGQMGLVSQMLAGIGRYKDIVSRVPPTNAAAANQSSRKDISVDVSGAALDPYIQRIVANSILEIERNVSGA
jgi:hypothetical protein